VASLNDSAGQTLTDGSRASSLGLSYNQLLARHRADASDGLYGQVRRSRWSSARLAVEREQKLRELLTRSVRDSSFYGERLRGIDISTFTPADLPSLPVLTKDDMMDNFDDVVTKTEITRGRAEGHLASLTTDGYLLERFRIISSGGSSGRRGLFAYDWTEWTTFVLMERRAGLAQAASIRAPLASLFSDNPAHVSGALHAFSEDPTDSMVHLPMTTDLPAIVTRLNALQPAVLQGYPTAINLLISEARAGRLEIAPSQVKTSGELVTPAIRQAVRSLWGVETIDNWGVSEGVYTSTCGAGAMHLPDDLVIIEPVDENGRAVHAGQRAAKIYLTNLYNQTQPLIRYEITDSMTVHTDPCACGSAHSWISNLGGRLSDLFVYPDGPAVHPAVLEGSLFRDRRVIEYRVWQTPNGVEVVLRTEGPIDLSQIRADLSDALRHAHLVDPDVTVRTVDRLDRVWSGKLSRFIPLGHASDWTSSN
jgi:phenylacetate-coenzyme A ligase PaaK-like adenylate-forming protein